MNFKIEVNKMEKIENGLSLVLNGGGETMNSATVPVRWFLSDEVLAKKPTYIILINQDEHDVEYCQGTVYIMKPEDLVKFLPIFSPGKYTLKAYAINCSLTIRDIEKVNNKHIACVHESFVEQLDVGYIKLDTLAKTAVEFEVPAELFAQKPTSYLGQKFWDWVNYFYETKPQDECRYRRRMILACTAQPFILLVWKILKIIIGLLYATYVVIGNAWWWFWGFPIKRVIPKIWNALRMKNQHEDWDDFMSREFLRIRCSNVKYKDKVRVFKSTWIRLEVVGRKKIVPWHIGLPLLAIGSVPFWAESAGAFFEAYVLPVILRAVSFFAGHLFIVALLAVLLVVCLLRFFALMSYASTTRRKAERAQRARQKYLAKEQKEEANQEKKIKAEQDHQAWLRETLSLSQKTEKVELQKITANSKVSPILRFKVSYWALKAKVCRPFAQVIILALLLPFIVRAQDSTFVPNIKITKTYVGVVGVGAIDTNYCFNNTSTLMMAFATEAKIQKDFSFLVNLTALNNLTQTVGHYYFQYGNRLSPWMLQVGQMGRLISLHRPNPVSPGMHFEPAAKGIIPGSSVGVTSALNYNEGQIIGGLFQTRNKLGASFLEYQGAIVQRIKEVNFRLTGLYSPVSKGLALNGNYQGNELSAYTDGDSLFSAFLNLSGNCLDWKIGDLYVDQIYDFQQKRFERLEIGWYDIYDVAISGIQGNICLGVAWREYPERSLRFYVWAYIFRNGGGR